MKKEFHEIFPVEITGMNKNQIAQAIAEYKKIRESYDENDEEPKKKNKRNKKKNGF